MGRQHTQHSLVIEAIRSIQGVPFSGWEITRRTAVPRATVSRIMGRLERMGLLIYDPDSRVQRRWQTSGDWCQPIETLYTLYERYDDAWAGNLRT